MDIFSSQERLVEHMRQVLKESYGDNPFESDSFAKIINKRHFE